MKLSPRPKPVRIRISLGGKEHTSLESLKENITPKILEFTDGRLQRWLKQQNLDSLSDAIDRIKENNRRGEPIKLLNIYNKLTGKSHKTLFSFVDEWKGDIKSKELLTYYIHNEKRDITVIENTLDYISLDEWCEIISPLNDSQLDFFLAKKYREKGNLLESIRILEKIKDRGDCPEAENFYLNNKNKYYKRILFADNTEDELLDVVEDLEKYDKLKITGGSQRARETVIKDFIKDCSVVFSSKTPNMRLAAADRFNFGYYYKNGFGDEERCVKAIAFCYYDIRYSSDVKEYTSIIRPVSKEYINREIVEKCIKGRSYAECLNCVKDIIRYLLFDKFTK